MNNSILSISVFQWSNQKLFFFLILQQSEKIENFVKTGVPSKSPYLVYAEANQTESNDTAMVFVNVCQ